MGIALLKQRRCREAKRGHAIRRDDGEDAEPEFLLLWMERQFFRPMSQREDTLIPGFVIGMGKETYRSWQAIFFGAKGQESLGGPNICFVC